MALTAGMRVHWMGVGGIGMSGLADICLSRGLVISGCDMKVNSTARRLAQRGAFIMAGHDPAHLDAGVDLLVYSAAVRADAPELAEARKRGVRTITRGQCLGELAEGARLIGVAGAHGKTTTSGMASELLIHAGWDPTVAVGGIMVAQETNARHGRGAYLVAETDESDGSFLHLSPDIALVTNIDREHVNHYGSFDQLVAAFCRFVGQIRPGGALIRCDDNPLIRRVLAHPRQMSYGLNPDADVTAGQITLDEYSSRFQASFKGRALGSFALQVPGQHNVLNALGVIALGLTLELPLITIREGLAEFQGTERRFQVLRLPGDIWFVEDYAHHPSEIEATLSADAAAGRRRLVVFQPHRFSRTHSLEREFSACFDRADGVIVTDIYSAFEPPIPGVSGERLAGLIQAHGHPCVRYVPKQNLSMFVNRIARSGDTIFFLGAGDIGAMCHDLADQLHSSERTAR